MQFRMDAFNLFNHPQYNNPNNGNTNGYVSIGFSANNCIPTVDPKCPAGSAPAFLDSTGALTKNLASAVSVINSAPSSQVGTVNADSQRDRQWQYSLRFTF